MNTQQVKFDRITMDVDPNEIVVDLPVNDGHVAQLMVSMQAFGQAENIILRASDMRVVNGFHRVVAALRLGWKTIRADVCDYDEETFWSARIIAAKTHKEIEGVRLATWMLECWKQTRWYVPIEMDRDGLFPRAYSNTSLNLSLVESVWGLFGKKQVFLLGADTTALSSDEQEILDWICKRSLQWGIGAGELADILLNTWGLSGKWHDLSRTYDDWARKYNLDVKRRKRLQKEILREPGRYSEPSREIANEFVEQVVATDKDESYRDFAERKQRETREAKSKEEWEEELRWREREASIPPEIKAHRQERAATKRASEFLHEIRCWLREIEQNLVESSEGAQLLGELVVDVTAMHKRLFPNGPEPSALNKAERENIELRRANKALQRQVNGLTHKKAVVQPSQKALSSTDIEAIR